MKGFSNILRILKASLKLPMGKWKPGCEAGAVAMTTEAEEMRKEGRHLAAQLCRALKKRPDTREEVELIPGRGTQNVGQECDHKKHRCILQRVVLVNGLWRLL